MAKTVGGVTTRYLVDDLSPTGYTQVLEEVVGGAVQTRYTYGRNVVSQTRNVSSTAATSYYGYDAHGNVTFLTDGTGAVTDSYDYDAWGTLVASTGSTPNTRRYVGEEFDPDLGLINLRARSFNTATGRFLTLDPMEPSGTASKDPLGSSTWNKYLYASGDPVNRINPSGRADALEYAIIAARITLFIITVYNARQYMKGHGGQRRYDVRPADGRLGALLGNSRDTGNRHPHRFRGSCLRTIPSPSRRAALRLWLVAQLRMRRRILLRDAGHAELIGQPNVDDKSDRYGVRHVRRRRPAPLTSAAVISSGCDPRGHPGRRQEQLPTGSLAVEYESIPQFVPWEQM